MPHKDFEPGEGWKRWKGDGKPVQIVGIEVNVMRQGVRLHYEVPEKGEQALKASFLKRLLWRLRPAL